MQDLQDEVRDAVESIIASRKSANSATSGARLRSGAWPRRPDCVDGGQWTVDGKPREVRTAALEGERTREPPRLPAEAIHHAGISSAERPHGSRVRSPSNNGLALQGRLGSCPTGNPLPPNLPPRLPFRFSVLHYFIEVHKDAKHYEKTPGMRI